MVVVRRLVLLNGGGDRRFASSDKTGQKGHLEVGLYVPLRPLQREKLLFFLAPSHGHSV